jgi:choline dehydrogenase-like flavoprotein
MSKTYVTAIATAAAMTVSTLGGAAQAAQPRFDTSLATPGDAQLIQAAVRCYPGERSFDCRNRFQYERRNHNTHYVWRDGRYVDDNNGGAAVAGGILGFVLGAAIAGSQDDQNYYNSHRNDRRWRNRCRSAYHGWDDRSGTYIGDDGYRHYCRQ